MNRRVQLYVIATVAAAVLATGLVAWFVPVAAADEGAYLRAVACLSAVALLTQLLGFSLTRAAKSSISFVPFLASAAIAPSWMTAAGVLLMTLPVQITRSRGVVKAAFNTAQQCLSVSVAMLAYHAVGGESLMHPGVGMPYFQLVVLFATFFTMNSFLVSGVVSLSEERSLWDVWSVNTLGTLPYDLLAWPIIMCLAWVYVKYHTAGAFAFAVPLLGLRQLYKTNADLEKTNQDLLELAVAAIEARDPYTSGHSRRVSQNARVIAQIVGLRQSEIKRVEIAALLHDVGKIHEIYAPILQKPGRLTKEEHEVMQTHPIKSEELVSKVSQLRDIVSAVRHHHENWDGTGYPDGIAGERIPLGSRIIMFADTIDAMTSDRPYRKALDETAVRAELVKHRARQFDPAICDALLSSPRYSELFSHMTPSDDGETVPHLRLAVQ